MNPYRWIRNIIYNLDFCRTPMRTRSYSASSRQVPAQWLQRVLEDRTEPPRLYAWTLGNLPDGATHHSSSSSSSNTSTSNKNNESEESKQKHKQKLDDNDDEQRRIYILGIGNIGRLYASFLAKNTPRPPVTLVVHRRALLEHWAAHPGIEMAVRDGSPERNADFDIEWWTDAKPSRGPVREPGAAAGADADAEGLRPRIRNLVVATKAADAMPLVDGLRAYLGQGSAVAFAQNGMCKLWPPAGPAYVGARWGGGGGGGSPDWLACVTTHGVTSLGPFRSVHTAPADVLVGAVLRGGGAAQSPSPSPSDYLAAQIVAAPGLAARAVSTRDLWVAQLEKLVVNSVINPLTAVLRCKNGELFADRGDGVAAVIDALLREASRTLRALVVHPSCEDVLVPPDNSGREEALQSIREELLERFSFARLAAMLRDVSVRVAENTSSMLQDVRAGKKTEIDDFNGWLVETARFLGDDRRLPAHEMLVSLVVEGVTLTRSELGTKFNVVPEDS
ncbi:6-phosphogluconate dehydrogenase C-terminal domain-like protein [Hypoxylon sp. NC1633]|nr:6-phosphogluconate dehydrogenase C-terminal domain-like protein [Hypoxylon sp. NC1633]